MKLVTTLTTTVCLLFVFANCKNSKKETSMKPDKVEIPTKLSKDLNLNNFEMHIDGDSVQLYTLKNKNGIEVAISNYGQRIISIHAPDKNGDFADIVLGYPHIENYLAKKNYYGATIGRYGNRIAKGKFTIDGTVYDLAINNNENHLHGGIKGFESVIWNVDKFTEDEIVFSRTSPDMEEGYPGNLTVKVKYTLTDANELKINYEATTDKATYINLTHHSFFNLKGEGEGDVNDHIVEINADYFTPVNQGLIPLGELREVANTPFDFTEPKPIGKDLDSDYEQLKLGNGYDHNFVLNDGPKNAEGLVFAAKVVETQSGRTLEVYTDEPGMQFYGGNFLDGSDIGKSGKPYIKRGSFCLETQHYPDSPNQPSFPSTRLDPGRTYISNCVYKFGVVKN